MGKKAEVPSKGKDCQSPKNSLLPLFQRGLIPGPSEQWDAFKERVSQRHALPDPIWDKIHPFLRRSYGFAVDWIKIVYSSKKLLPWEAAVCLSQEGKLSYIQIRPSFKLKNRWGTSPDEILIHESIHAAREAFDEPQFEEILAYSTSPKKWKAWIGPCFQRIWEFPLLLLSSMTLILTPWIFIAIFFYFLIRLTYRQILFYRVKKKFPLSLICCMTDKEIKQGCFLISNEKLPRDQLIQELKSRFL